MKDDDTITQSGPSDGAQNSPIAAIADLPLSERVELEYRLRKGLMTNDDVVRIAATQDRSRRRELISHFEAQYRSFYLFAMGMEATSPDKLPEHWLARSRVAGHVDVDDIARYCGVTGSVGRKAAERVGHEQWVSIAHAPDVVWACLSRSVQYGRWAKARGVQWVKDRVADALTLPDCTMFYSPPDPADLGPDNMPELWGLIGESVSVLQVSSWSGLDPAWVRGLALELDDGRFREGIIVLRPEAGLWIARAMAEGTYRDWVREVSVADLIYRLASYFTPP